MLLAESWISWKEQAIETENKLKQISKARLNL